MYIRKTIRPFVKILLRKSHSVEVTYINELPKLPTACIFAANHSCRFDIPIAICAVLNNTKVLVGKQRMALIEKFGLFLVGTIWVDRKNKRSRNNIYEKMVELLKDGVNLLIFPEGTWNLTPSLPMLPLYYGVVRMAKDTKLPIVPLIEEYRGGQCFVKFGQPFYVEEEVSKQEALRELRDIMATLKWEIWESFPLVKRSETDDSEWDNEARRRIEAFPEWNDEYESSVVRRE